MQLQKKVPETFLFQIRVEPKNYWKGIFYLNKHNPYRVKASKYPFPYLFLKVYIICLGKVNFHEEQGENRKNIMWFFVLKQNNKKRSSAIIK